MRNLSILPVVLCAALAPSSPTFSQGLGNPLSGLADLKNYESRRASSTDANEQGNGDARGIPAGGKLVIADLKGPGRIVHIWTTIAANEKFYGRKVVIRMYWDDEPTPSVDVPFADFWAVGHGLERTVNSLPIRVTSNGKGRNCYWPMPFKKSARIEVLNQGKQAVQALYYYVDWQNLPKLDKDTAYFHAKYRQEFPTTSPNDYLILDARGRGHYVGTVLSIRQNTAGWWGEGDDKFYIDGAEKPTFQGTGSEDYFCDGWGLRDMDGLYYGTTMFEGYDRHARTTAYRWHIPDPVAFTKSLRVTIEHKGTGPNPDGSPGGYAIRADDFSSVAYWYQTEPHYDFFTMPGPDERLYNKSEIAIEGESLLSGAKTVSEMKPVVQQLGGWSGGAQLFYLPPEAGASLDLPLDVSKAGNYDVVLALTRSFDYGVWTARLDDNKPVDIDLYDANVTLAPEKPLGTYDLTEGPHVLHFVNKGKNSASAGYYFGLDAILLRPNTASP